jgi:ribosomal protein S18 acetylase RimI-like enzyme
MLDAAASDETVVRAAAANQAAWMARVAVAAGGVVHRQRGVTWMSSRAGAVLAFPRVSRERLESLLPRFLEAAAESAPETSCWSLLPTQPPDLDAALHAIGFREGWQAHWMAMATDDADEADAVAGVRVGVVEEEWWATELPWDGAGIASVRMRLTSARPRRVWHLGAWRDGEPVGHATLNVTTGKLGVAGIYDMGVARHERRRGIGRALTVAALELGRSARCAVATLNATPEGELLYRRLGFRSVGIAQTWWR